MGQLVGLLAQLEDVVGEFRAPCQQDPPGTARLREAGFSGFGLGLDQGPSHHLANLSALRLGPSGAPRRHQGIGHLVESHGTALGLKQLGEDVAQLRDTGELQPTLAGAGDGLAHSLTAYLGGQGDLGLAGPERAGAGELEQPLAHQIQVGH